MQVKEEEHGTSLPTSGDGRLQQADPTAARSAEGAVAPEYCDNSAQ